MRRTTNRNQRSKKKTVKQLEVSRSHKTSPYQVSENHLRFDKPGATPPATTTQYTGGYASRHTSNHRAATSSPTHAVASGDSYQNQRYYEAIFAMPEASSENVHNIAIAVFGMTYHVTSSDMNSI